MQVFFNNKVAIIIVLKMEIAVMILKNYVKMKLRKKNVNPAWIVQKASVKR